MNLFSAFLWSLSTLAASTVSNQESIPPSVASSATVGLLALAGSEEPSAISSGLFAGKCVAQTFCVYGQLDASGDNVDFTIHSAAKGWVALGITSTASMINASVIMGWKNSSVDGRGYTVSDRYSSDHIMPASASGDGKSTVLPLLVPLPDWASIGFSFKRPLKVGRSGVDSSVVLGKDTAFIYAFSNKPPIGNVDDPLAKFRIHGLSDCGSLGVIDFISPPKPPLPLPTTTSSTPGPTPTSSSSSICAPEANTFCLYGEPDDAMENIIFTIHSKALGWAAMGTGDDMSSSSITVGWKNSTGGITLSERVSKEEAMPLPAPSPTSQLLASPRVPKPDWASLAFSFSRPIKGSGALVFSPTMHYIYAFAAKPPRSLDSPTSSFSRHDKYGSFGMVNFLEKGGGPKPPPPSSTAPPSPSPTPNSSGSNGDTTSECISGVFCVYGEPDGNGNVLITLHAAAKGWVGLGVGSSMSNSAMIVGWKNSAGSYVVSDRKSTSNSLPDVSPSLSKLVALKHPAPSWANLAFTVSRPFQASFGSISSASTFIYAFSDKTPSNPDSASSSFSKHSSAGSLGVLDFTSAKGSGNAPPPTPEGKGGIVAQTQNGVGSSCINSLYCVYSEPDGNGNVYITLMAASGGWVGLGTGTSMDNSFMIVGWKNSSGGYTVSERTSKDSVMPSLAPSDVVGSSKLVALRVEKPSWAALAFTVLRPLKSNAVTYTPTTSFIYAYSSSIPASIDSPLSNFAVHTGRGQLGVLDFTTIHSGVSSRGSKDTSDSSSPDSGSGGGDGVLGSTCIPNQFCVYSEPDERGNVYITLQSSLSGWVGLGTGDAMAGSFMIAGWKNSSGGYTVSDRVATGEAMPDVASTQASIIVSPRIPAPSWAQLSFTILRPLKTSEITFTPSTKFIYGISSKSPSSLDDSQASFQIHDRFGKLGNLDFTTKHAGVGTAGGDDNAPILQLPAGIEYATVIRIHGYVMIYAWIACPLVAIFIARYLKSRLGHLWFELHRAIMIIGCFFGTVGGTLIIFLFKSGSHFSSTTSLHPLFGLLIGIILVIQIGLGVASDKLFSPDRPFVPWWDKAHWWAGRIVCFFAAANIVTGILYADHFEASALALPVLFGLILSLGIVAFVLGERHFGQVHHIKLQDQEDSSHGAAGGTNTLV